MTEHFTWGDVIASNTASRLKIDNSLQEEEHRSNARFLGAILEQFYWAVGPITSWYRCPELNMEVGGVPTSQHTKGLAVDFLPAAGWTPSDVAELLYGMTWLPIDQVVIYDSKGHVHVGVVRKGQRREFLKYVNGVANYIYPKE